MSIEEGIKAVSTDHKLNVTAETVHGLADEAILDKWNWKRADAR